MDLNKSVVVTLNEFNRVKRDKPFRYEKEWVDFGGLSPEWRGVMTVLTRSILLAKPEAVVA